MKKRISLFLILAMCISLSLAGCGRVKSPDEVNMVDGPGSINEAARPTPEVSVEPSPSVEPSKELTPEPEATPEPDVESEEDEEEEEEEEEYEDENPYDAFEKELLYIGEGEYFPDIFEIPEDAVYHNAKLNSKVANDIIDEDEWLENNGFLDPRIQSQEGYYIGTDELIIYRGGDDIFHPTLLVFSDEYFNLIGTIDFEQYIAPTRIESENWPTVPACVTYAEVVNEPDGRRTLYASISHATYSSYYPDNAYILCIDFDTQVLLWKSQALVSNAYNFTIKDGTIFCGYGFSDEDDYLYALNRYNGWVQDRIKLKTGPDFIFERDNQLYVRCYDTDYVFDIMD